MARIIAPDQSFAGFALTQKAQAWKAAKSPFFQTVPKPGVLLEFSSAGETKELPVPIPRLPGLDELEIEELGFDLSSAANEIDASSSGQPSGGAVRVTCSVASGAVARLVRVELEDLRVTASAAKSYALAAEGAAGTAASVGFVWDVEKSDTTTAAPASGPLEHIHLLIRPATADGLGPPMAAAPAFEMPGDGRTMYGPALGGASVSLSRNSGGKVRAILSLDPPLACSSFAIIVGTAGESSPNEGLPNDVTPVKWSAQSVRGVFDVRPASVNVRAAGPGAESNPPLVAEFPADPGDQPVHVDFAPAARILAKQALPSAPGADLGLKLLFTAGSPGVLRVNLGPAKARYLHRPLAAGPLPVNLRGAPENAEVVVPAGLQPSALSFTADGVYGPARLTLDSDTATPDGRHGFRLSGPVWLARRVMLTVVEAHLPIARLAVFGRASEMSELLLTLHGGDDLRIGPPVGVPLSIEVSGAPTPAWHRVSFAKGGLLPPHPQSLWLLAQVTKGVFWWHGPLDASGSTQRSSDGGSTFAEAAGRPLGQVAVIEEDSPTHSPVPLHPISLLWNQGALENDLAQVTASVSPPEAQFRRFWLAARTEQPVLLDGIAGLGGVLRLSLACQRDADLHLSEMALTYDPWNAKHST